jgi:rare lipoprotein A
MQVPADPGARYIRLGTCGRRPFAERQRARAAGLDAEIIRTRTGRSETYRLRVGPFADVAGADAALARAIADGIPDARIVVE